ncbi:arsenic resistance N-acetyltransferase ArsN2 [Daejeonella sp. JGW-45]|uniref:arsenic resistance N-acetyltransferase ArsN2 n=1 Tax=Daejeonella sp. JGW-45 TaxID=3034148 RepID=UPI0023EAFECA|nr:arsenic resistance N-acetyltransferase ArsN2 [Daejeonella sp. JGW-45]
MKIEQASDRESIVALLASQKLPVEDLPEMLNSFLIARTNDQLAGVVGLETYGDFALLRSLVVHPEFRGQGIADQLIRNIESHASSKGLKEIYLLTETAPEYFDRRAYLRITRNEVPEEVQQSSEFSHVCPQSATVMKKTLNPL